MKKAAQAIPNVRLKSERELRSLSQGEVADRIGTTAFNVSRWERGITVPSPHFRRELCTLFEKSLAELGLLIGETEEKSEEQTSTVSSEGANNQAGDSYEKISPAPAIERTQPLWSVPGRRNPFFTGREALLLRLREALVTGEGAVQAISGLGGIGKTQLVLEYAYRHRSDYQAVLWVHADTYETLTSDFAGFAALLQLPERHEQDQRSIVAAVKRGFNHHSQWLLILDNADDLALVKDFIPAAGQGHTLLTTRAAMTGTIAHTLAVEKMALEEGVHFLLRRAKGAAGLPSPDEISLSWSKIIVEMMDGLPLALDQAAAYIEETSCGLAGYARRYQRQHASFLKRRGSVPADHPDPVAATWSLSFEQIGRANPVAADLLKLCAFLVPDAIPEELIVRGVAALQTRLRIVASDPLELDAAIETLRMFSLISRDPEGGTLSLHRLVQDVLKDQMDEQTQRTWAEDTVRVVHIVFPIVEFAAWPLCQDCLPHALLCAQLIEQWQMTLPEAPQLLNKAGQYLRERGLYAQAEQLLTQALDIYERLSAPPSVDLAHSLHNLGALYYQQGRYDLAERFLQRALTVYREVLDAEHPRLAQCLNDLAELYRVQGKYEQSESLTIQALEIRERGLGAEHADVAESLALLGALHQVQGKFDQAEMLLQRTLDIRRRALGGEHPKIAETLNNLAFLYNSQGRYAQAEPLYQQTLAFCEQNLGSSHLYTAITLQNLAEVHRAEGRYDQAEQLHQRALEVLRALENEHPQVAKGLCHLAEIYTVQERYSEAEALALRAHEVWQNTLGQNHPGIAIAFNALAELYSVQGRHGEAERVALQALELRRRAWGPEHRAVGRSLTTLAEVYRRQAQYTRAEPLLQQALAILRGTQGETHPYTIECLNNLVLLYALQGRDSEAETLVASLVKVSEGLPVPLARRVEATLLFLTSSNWKGKSIDAANVF